MQPVAAGCLQRACLEACLGLCFSHTSSAALLHPLCPQGWIMVWLPRKGEFGFSGGWRSFSLDMVRGAGGGASGLLFWEV